MATANLTVGMMETIARAVCQHRYDAEQAALKQRGAEIGDRLYNELFPPKLIAQVKKAPKEFINFAGNLRIHYKRGDETTTYHPALSEERPVPAYLSHYGHLDLKAPHPIMDEWAAHSKQTKKLNDARRDAYKEIMGALRGFRTTKALRTAWPEVASFIPEETVTPDRPLQRVPAQLNKDLRLPPKEKNDAGQPAAGKPVRRRAAKRRG